MDSQGPSLSPKLSNGIKKSPDDRLLPPGWAKVKSDQGAYYYWDKKSGKTTWRFPEEEAKAHQEKMRNHSYENIRLQMAANKKEPKNSKHKGTIKNMDDQQPLSQTHTYVNVVDHTHLAEEYSTIPPPPPMLQMSDGGASPSSATHLAPASALPLRDDVETERGRSSTPPIPERHYSDTDVHMTPPPPLPQRQYSDDDLLEPLPPLPERRYTASDVGQGGSGQSQQMRAAAVLTTQAQQGEGSSATAREEPETRDRSKSLDFEDVVSGQFEISEVGSHYARVIKGKSVDQGGNCKGPDYPPPLPKRVRERFNENSPYPTFSSENLSQSGDMVRRFGYIDVDHSELNSEIHFRANTIAYAVVKVGETSGDSREKDVQPTRRSKTPRPYEDPILAPPSLPTGDGKSKRVPAYEEVDIVNSHKVDADGYTEVKHEDSGTDGYAEVKRASTGNLLLSRTRATDSGGSECLSQVKQRSLDQPPSLPPLPGKPGSGSPGEFHDYHTLDVSCRTPGSDVPEGGKSPGEVLSQDSVFDSNLRYDLPSNSRKLTAMNVTLRRNEDPAAMQGYAKLDLSKEALLLRSGVTLRRLNHYSLSSVSSFIRDDGSPEGSDVGSGTTPDAATDEEDGLEPVNKCIKSLEVSLGVSADQMDSDNVELSVPMTLAPSGPPSWLKYKRRPHTYEEVMKGGSQDDSKPVLSSVFDPNMDVSKTMSSLDMQWDNSDMGMGLGMKGTSYTSKAGSCSQPNLLRETKPADRLFPHLVKPERVSEEAFQLRKARLMQHKYEEVNETSGMGGAGGPVGDVNVLTSAVRESWLEVDKNSPPSDTKLPRGWKALKDDEGREYFWHVPTGKTQYERPSNDNFKRRSLQVDEACRSSTQSPPPAAQHKLKSLTFAAHYLGSLDVLESELVQGQCVEVVHSCVRKLIAALSEQPSSSHQGKVVFLQVHKMELRWLNPADSCSIFAVQPINRIRVWGIGLENERDFGYVARDNQTKKYKCHVFRCDVPARAVVRALLESHQQREKRAEKKEEEEGRKRYSTEGSSGRSTSPEADTQGNHNSSKVGVATNPVSSYTSAHGGHEHYERIECTYIGSCEVSHGMGMETLNEAVDRLSPMTHRWLDVNVDVATSNIRISDTATSKLLYDHRVRFLCFLGIAKDDRFCGYILDGGERNGEKVFYFHGFKKEPNTDSLCLALHSACQARYRRVLDAHPEIAAGKEKQRTKESPDRGRIQSSSSSLFGRLGSLRKVKKQMDDERSQGFVVQYCGYQTVPRQDGLEMVKEVIQQLAVPKLSSSTASPAHLVEFDVSPSGISLTDPQKKFFGRKHFSTKSITYVLRIRNYFAFVVKDSGKFCCHVFLETEVDAGTVVMTVQRVLVPDTSKQQKK